MSNLLWGIPNQIIGGIQTGVQNFGRGIGTMLGQQFDPNLATFEAFVPTTGYTLDALKKNPDAMLQVRQAYNNAINAQTAQNQAALAPWGLGLGTALQGFGAFANWWGMNKSANLAEKALKNQLAFQRTNFNNSAELIDELRAARKKDADNWMNRDYVAPTPLMRV